MIPSKKFSDLPPITDLNIPGLEAHFFKPGANYRYDWSLFTSALDARFKSARIAAQRPEIISSFKTNAHPMGIAIGNNMIAVCNSGAGNVTLHNFSSLSLALTITVPNCKAIAYVDSSKEFWVTGNSSDIYIIRADFSVMTIALANSRGIFYDKETDKIYIGGVGTIYEANTSYAYVDIGITAYDDVWHFAIDGNGVVWFSTSDGSLGNIQTDFGLVGFISDVAGIGIFNSSTLFCNSEYNVACVDVNNSTVSYLPTPGVPAGINLAVPSTLNMPSTQMGKMINGRRLSSHTGVSSLIFSDVSNPRDQYAMQIGVGSIGDMYLHAVDNHLYVTDYYQSQVLIININDI